jgi:LEA14-like dessication related protein
MSLKHKIPFVCFLALNTFSVIFLSYTVYVTFGTSEAIRSMSGSLSKIRIDENESKAYFSLILYNPSSIHLGIFAYRAKMYSNDSYIGEKVKTFQDKSLPLPPNIETNLTITLTLNNQVSHSDVVWKVVLYLRIETPLPLRGSRSITLEK